MDKQNKNRYDVVQSLKKNILSGNPLLIECIGFSPAVIAASDLKLALGISALTIVSVLITGVIASIMSRFVPERMKIVIVALLSAGIALVEESLSKAYFPSLYDRLGILFPFVAFNCFTLLFIHSFAFKNNITVTLIESFFGGAGFSAALCVFAAVREILAGGTILGARVFGGDNTGIAFFSHPAGIMILAGVIAALFKALGSIGDKKNNNGGTKEK